MNENRAKLIEVAQNSVQRTGLKALSFRTLADEVGIKSSSVHYYFPEKSDLARELIEQYRDSVFAELNDITTRNESLSAQFVEFVNMFDIVAKRNQICLCCMMAAEYELLSEENQTLLKQVFDSMEQWLVRLFDARRDELITPVPSEQLAKIILSGLQGAMLVDRVMKNSQARLDAHRDAILLLIKQEALSSTPAPTSSFNVGA